MTAVGLLTRGVISPTKTVLQPSTTAAPKMATVITVKPKMRTVKST